MEMIKTEVGKTRPEKTESKPMKSRVQKETENIDQTQGGEFILDSATAPYFVKSIPTDGKSLNINGTV